MVGSVRQGYAILATMATIWAGFVALMMWTEFTHRGPALEIAGGAMEGKEVRFGIGGSSIFAVSTTLTSTGAVDSFHSSFTGLGGGITMLGMMLGEIAPGLVRVRPVLHADHGGRRGVHRRADGLLDPRSTSARRSAAARSSSPPAPS
ncbi:Potassium-transporting ATPase potassium-binding subunit [Streptomyces hirsutus]